MFHGHRQALPADPYAIALSDGRPSALSSIIANNVEQSGRTLQKLRVRLHGLAPPRSRSLVIFVITAQEVQSWSPLRIFAIFFVNLREWPIGNVQFRDATVEPRLLAAMITC